MKKVVKFGGSSLASAEQFKKVGDIIRSDASRRYVVPSAPGKRHSKDTKVTDMLYACYALAEADKDFSAALQKIRARYDEIIKGLGLKMNLDSEFKTIEKNFKDKAGSDYAASRGEYLNGIIMAEYLGFPFIDAAEVIRFDAKGNFDADTTDSLLKTRLEKNEYAVVPGFYGAYKNGTVKTFSRGGSDITGSIVAKAARVDVYENWTDVSGFLMADPRIVKNPKQIRTVSYKELRELSYMGASVLHEDAIYPARIADVPINIRNTNDPEDPGTMIVSPERAEQLISGESSRDIITGIAGSKDFTVVTLYKNMMSQERGFVRRILGILDDYDINFEHLPSGIDTVSVVMSNKQINGRLDEILVEFQSRLRPDSIDVIENIAQIATVGHKMSARRGTAATLFTALANAGVNIRMIDQGSSELNIIVGVDNNDFNKAIQAIYRAFVEA